MKNNLLFNSVTIVAMILSACGTPSQAVTPVSSIAATPNVTVTFKVTVTSSPQPAPETSLYPTTLQAYIDGLKKYAAYASSPHAETGAAATQRDAHNAALHAIIESQPWWKTEGLATAPVREQIAAINRHNPGNILDLPTDMYLAMIDVQSYIDAGLAAFSYTDENGRFYGIPQIANPTTFDPNQTVFEFYTTDQRWLSAYAKLLFGATDVEISRELNALGLSGLAFTELKFAGLDPSAAVILITLPDGSPISPVVVSFRDGVKFDMEDKGSSLLDISGPEFASLIKTTTLVIGETQYNLTRSMLEWLLDHRAYMQVQTGNSYLDGAKNATKLTASLDEKLQAEFTAKFGTGN